MYEVMMVDDDYPVLELLSETIPWEQLGLRLNGLYDNGANAYEGAIQAMPDILITDIGMPKMDGLELIKRLKELKPDLRVVILSCHSEFHYAQQAIKLNVQDYVVKETLDPQMLTSLLGQFRDSMEQELRVSHKQSQLELRVNRSLEAVKEKFIRSTIHQPILDSIQWRSEAENVGLRLDEKSCMTILAYIERYRQVKKRFVSDETLRFAVSNVIGEVAAAHSPDAIHFAYSSKESFLLMPHKSSLKLNPFQEATELAQAIQNSVRRTLKISMSFVLGRIGQTPEEIKSELNRLLDFKRQRFYLPYETITKQEQLSFSADDIFSKYEQMNESFRTILLGKQIDRLEPAVQELTGFLRDKRFPPEQVRDWILKLLLDLRIKLQSLQYFRPAYTVDILHDEILEMDSLDELQEWLIHYLQSAMTSTDEWSGNVRRSEVVEAMEYVSLHLDKRIGLEEMAEHLHLNNSYFSRLFKKETGRTFIDYVTHMKLTRAKELLDQTNHSVGKISEALGYDNQSYFIKLFKANTGVTPVEYRGHKG